MIGFSVEVGLSRVLEMVGRACPGRKDISQKWIQMLVLFGAQEQLPIKQEGSCFPLSLGLLASLHVWLTVTPRTFFFFTMNLTQMSFSGSWSEVPGASILFLA